MNRTNLSKDKVSLIVVNLLPLIGIAFFDWSLFNFLFLYWLESFVVGFYYLLKMVKAARERGGTFSVMLIGQSVFFFFHYGAFMAGHLVFIWFMVQKYDPVTSFNWYGFLFLIFNLITLFVSHGISYQQNFIKGKEYERAQIFLLFGAPYRRIAVMHLVVLLGSMLISGWGWPLYIVVIIKLAADYWAHINAHKVKFQTEMIEKVFDQFEKESNLGSITKINNQDVPAILNDKLKR